MGYWRGKWGIYKISSSADIRNEIDYLLTLGDLVVGLKWRQEND